MKTADPALIQLLNTSTQFKWADLYTIVLKNGVTIRYVNRDLDVTLGGVTYSSSKGQISRSQIKMQLGLQVDNLTVTIAAGSDIIALVLSDGTKISVVRAAYLQLFDGGAVTVQRLFMSGWGDYSIPPLLLWVGNVSSVQASATEVILICVSPIEKLNVQLPKNIIQPGCYHTLFDAGCGLDKNLFAEALSVGPGSNALTVPSSSAKAASYYDQGQIVWTSGLNTGITSGVLSFAAGGVFTLNVPPPFTISTGDAFIAYPGCDKIQATCQAKFNNLVNFGGFPYVPAPETAA